MEHKDLLLFKKKVSDICDEKVRAGGAEVGVSFYAFFKNKNDDPDLLVKVAKF